MNNGKISMIAIVICFLVAGHSMAWATPVLHWSFTDPVQYVSPTDTVIFNATLYNDIGSDATVYGPNIRNVRYVLEGTTVSLPDISFQYATENPGVGGDVRLTPNFMSQFDNMVLTPGSSYDFMYLYAVPSVEEVTAGDYNLMFAKLFISDALTNSRIVLDVDDPGRWVVQPVPEPSSLILLAGGMFLFVVTRWSLSTIPAPGILLSLASPSRSFLPLMARQP